MLRLRRFNGSRIVWIGKWRHHCAAVKHCALSGQSSAAVWTGDPHRRPGTNPQFSQASGKRVHGFRMVAPRGCVPQSQDAVEARGTVSPPDGGLIKRLTDGWPGVHSQLLSRRGLGRLSPLPCPPR